MPAVKIKGTFSKNERSDNGLEDIANDLVRNEFARHTVIGIVELHKVTKEPGEAPIPTVRFLAVEPVDGDDEVAVKAILDAVRKGRGLPNLADTLFSAKPDFDYDDPKPAPEMPGQMEIRLSKDGEHEVPEPSGEELQAELDERRAARDGVPAATFSGGAE